MPPTTVNLSWETPLSSAKKTKSCGGRKPGIRFQPLAGFAGKATKMDHDQAKKFKRLAKEAKCNQAEAEFDQKLKRIAAVRQIKEPKLVQKKRKPAK